MYYRHEKQEKQVKYTGPRPDFPEVRGDYWPILKDYLWNRNLSASLARVNGWYPAYYRGSIRVIIPCSNSRGLVYFQGRDITGAAEIRYASPPVSRDDSIVLVWPKEDAKGMVIVEGPMDALAAADIGFLGAALMGNQPTQEVIDHLVRYARAFSPVLVLPDMDALVFGPNVLCGLSQQGVSGMILNPYKKDLADMTPAERKSILNVK